MTTVSFPTEAQYQFALQFLLRPGEVLFGSRLDPERRAIEVDSTVVGKLLARVAHGQATVLPYRGSGMAADVWLVTGASRRDLDTVLEHVMHFLVPSYAELGTPSHLPERQPFAPEANDLQRWGAELYPVGYYRLTSPRPLFDTILERLSLWMQLGERCPPLKVQERPSYAGLYADFTQALAAANWRDADVALGAMRRHYLSTADNLAFLSIQALAQQQRWDEIWRRQDFGDLAKLRVPRLVRAALLTAFHHAELLAIEEQDRWDAAVETFKQHRPRLGRLLTGRLDLSQAPVVQVFAYEAVLAGDRAALEGLRPANPSHQVQRCLDALARLLPSPPKADHIRVLTPVQRARRALADADFDMAQAAAGEVEQPIERALLLMDIAFQSSDAVAAEAALLAFWALADAVQAQLRLMDARVPFYVDALERLVRPAGDVAHPLAPSTPAAPFIVASWLGWFAAAQHGADATDLEQDLSRLDATVDERYWTTEHVRQLVAALQACLNAPGMLERTYVRSAMRRLVGYFLRDDDFPRAGDEYGDLYEALYTSHVLVSEVNRDTSSMLLRLLDALLARAPARREQLWADVQEWFAFPVPRTEDRVIEALELFADYGLRGGLAASLYREWVTALLSQPHGRERSALEAWLAIGRWAQPGDDLLHHLTTQLDAVAERDGDNPLTTLPDGYRIGIFSFRASSAERAKQFLLARNERLDVQICGAKDLDAQAKALAQHADLVVIVATCISHALFYGIGPYLASDPVYPASSGSTGIVRSIEERVRQY